MLEAAADRTIIPSARKTPPPSGWSASASSVDHHADQDDGDHDKGTSDF
jgi:hypothetical protein